MTASEIADPLFREAIHAIDTGDLDTLEQLLARHESLVRDRLEHGEGYFRNPYLLWFIAENPIRTGKLPPNIAQLTRTIIEAARRRRVDSLQDQLDYTLGLVSSGCVPREQGAQIPLIDTLLAAGADPASALITALAHRELAAATHLLARGAPLTLLAAACTGQTATFQQLLPDAPPAARQSALAGAALHGHATILALLIGSVNLNAYNPPELHGHCTALHNAVSSGSLAAVKVLVEAGADLTIKDRLFDGTPLGWAKHLEHGAIAEYLLGKSSRG